MDRYKQMVAILREASVTSVVEAAKTHGVVGGAHLFEHRFTDLPGMVIPARASHVGYNNSNATVE